MQLGHENSNHLRPLAGPRLSDRAFRFGDLNQKEDPRASQLDLRISGESRVMRSLKTLILRAADCNSTILITGESGTGKELIARSIHDFGQRQREPFLAINCGAQTDGGTDRTSRSFTTDRNSRARNWNANERTVANEASSS